MVFSDRFLRTPLLLALTISNVMSRLSEQQSITPIFPQKNREKYIMNHTPVTLAVDNPAEGLSIRAFLQQAVDHYPRLAAFSFTALLPHSETMPDKQTLIARFHTEVWQCTGEYSWQRQQARQSSPPTVLRWIWESVSMAECKMVLLLNIDTLTGVRTPALTDSVLQEMYAIIGDAWRTVTGTANNVAGMSSFIISRPEREAFTTLFGQLQLGVDEMASPVMTTRTDAVCP